MGWGKSHNLILILMLLALVSCTSKVTSGGDPNDDQTCIPPGTTEICGDAIDQDCDGTDQICPSCSSEAQITNRCLCRGILRTLGYCCTSGFNLQSCQIGPAVTVSSVSSNTLTQGQNYTISGSGFAVKNPVAPLRWDDFEDGTIGERLPIWEEGGWDTIGVTGIFPHYSIPDPSKVPHRIADEKVAEQTYITYYNQQIGIWDRFEITNLYATWWAYRYDVNGNYSCSTNQKLLGNFGRINDGSNYGAPQCRADQHNDQGGHLYATDINGDARQQSYFADIWVDHWYRAERFILLDSVTASDYSFVKKDGKLLAQISYDFLGPGRLPYEYFIMGQFFRLNNEDTTYPAPPTCTASMIQYVGEMYVDTTPARIEICDQASWTESSEMHCEIQIPQTTWNNTTIHFKANKGSFSTGQTLYLYVINQDLAFNPNGRQVSFN